MEDMTVWASVARDGARTILPEASSVCEGGEKQRKSQRRMLGSDIPWGPCRNKL